MQLLENVLGEAVLTNRPDELRFYCNECNDHKPRLYVNTSKGVYNCYNCGAHGTIVGLVSKCYKVNFKVAFEMVKDNMGKDFLPESIKQDILDRLKVFDYDKYMLKSCIPLPEGFCPLANSTSVLGKRARKYLHSRLVTDAMINRHKFGYCIDGEYEDRAILTIYEQDALQFWVARTTFNPTTKRIKKEMSPANEEYQISKSEVIFNIDYAAKNFGAIVVSEGIFDAVSYGDAGVATLGKQMSEEQVEKILKYKKYLTDGVYMSYDEDAISFNIKAAETLNRYLPVKMIEVKDDPNSMGRKACLKALGEAKPFGMKYLLEHKLNNYV